MPNKVVIARMPGEAESELPGNQTVQFWIDSVRYEVRVVGAVLEVCKTETTTGADHIRILHACSNMIYIQ